MAGDGREFRGIWIPREIWFDSRLTATEKVILLEIDSLDGEEGCYAGNDYLAEFCQCSERKVSDAISRLKELGYIEAVSFNGRKRVLHSLISARLPSKICEAESQNLRQIILVENTTSNKKETNKERKPGFRELVSEYTEDPGLRDALSDFIAMRKDMKAPMTERAVKLLFSSLDKLASDAATKTAIVNRSILNGWKGVYALNRDYKRKEAPDAVKYAEYRR